MPGMSSMSARDLYLKSQKAVNGWLDAYSAQVIVELSCSQQGHALAGAVGEIGVHEGRLFILLRLLRRAGENSVAIDVFEDQHLNVDRSGRGNLGRFEYNVERWSGNDNLVILQKSSLDVRPNELLDKAGKFRLFSVDGGHTEECAYNDLCLAEAVLSPGGIIILDDFSNHHWPSVAAGAARFFLERETTVRPFATSPNKMYVASPEYHERYRTALKASQGAHLYRSCTMFGHQVDIYEARNQRGGRLRRLPGLRTALNVARRAKRYWGTSGG
jgi:methyltransferase family protein